jgi:hypothetical protein
MSELYQQVLGKDWLELAENIRCAHAVGTEIHGVFRITHGSGCVAKFLARCSHLPKATETADTHLMIFGDDSRERWERKFNGKIFATEQWKGKGGELVERFKEWELHFKLRAEDGNLFYDQFRAILCLGALRIPMPRTFAPLVFAKETNGNGTQVFVSVFVTLPFIGLLISYEGHLNVEGKTT